MLDRPPSLDHREPAVEGTHRLKVQIRPAQFDSPARAIVSLKRTSLQIAIADSQRLREAIEQAVEPVIREWRASERMPPELLYPAIGLADRDDEMLDLVQGFVIDRAGLVRASDDLSTEEFGDLRRAHALGLIEGDLSSVIVVLMPSRAGVGGAGWEAFEDAFGFLWQHWQELGAAGGGWAALQPILKRVRRATDALTRLRESLESRGFTPPRAIELIERRRWLTDGLCLALGASPQAIGGLLTGLGFERQQNGLWEVDSPAVNEAARLLITAAVGYAAAVGDHDQLAEDFRALLVRLANVTRSESPRE